MEIKENKRNKNTKKRSIMIMNQGMKREINKEEKKGGGNREEKEQKKKGNCHGGQRKGKMEKKKQRQLKEFSNQEKVRGREK